MNKSSLTETIRNVISCVLASELSQHISEKHLECLRSYLTNENCGRTAIDVRFTVDGGTKEYAEASLSVDTDINWDSLRSDDEGTEWADYDIEVKVNYPAHGGTTPEIAMSRATLILQTANLARDITERFGGSKGMIVQITEEVKAHAVKREELRVQNLVPRLVWEHGREDIKGNASRRSTQCYQRCGDDPSER